MIQLPDHALFRLVSKSFGKSEIIFLIACLASALPLHFFDHLIFNSGTGQRQNIN